MLCQINKYFLQRNVKLGKADGVSMRLEVSGQTNTRRQFVALECLSKNMCLFTKIFFGQQR